MRVDVIDTSVEAVLGAITRIEERVRWGVRCVAKALLLPALVMLVGCASSPSATPASPNAGRYQISQDRAPTRVLKASEVRDVVPTAINRTMAGNRSPYEVLGKRYRVMSSEEGYFERGVASWYGEKFHGHKTSNGEIFDMYEVSAAHKSLPIPSFLKVTNLDNNRSIVVRVNDRGPFHGDRIIDLSYAAAVKLGYADRGTARVELEAIVVKGDAPRERIEQPQLARVGGGKIANQYLQVGAYSMRGSAQEVAKQLQGLTRQPVRIEEVRSSQGQTLHRVRIGPLSDLTEVDMLKARVASANLGTPYTVSD
ncbi:MAG: septal ring lytic transglycosylase RlpA family protein [Gammaproteobacteria bacterium]|jgi:rare lipoprotein A|nr:septal ring lytic transglycosylase RlpA family protein [Gammaproteobacteria bacterium]MBT5907669.1 septal ring lytic transglycosylase RlpA family protein [Gammaproteobacteria bacterium]MBT6317093.1 septal ring lytic transglycosylase RlpA family protein [Gammaproteobacteria bacterium]MBT7763697.1 septal ring lytic transglycosylase RlpA family protein [Gammaproteobacteria bacterium]MDG1514321.1 septal ring lytic transglycosylase RlpA family protein [Gammaproteobacteria bacterium]